MFFTWSVPCQCLLSETNELRPAAGLYSESSAPISSNWLPADAIYHSSLCDGQWPTPKSLSNTCARGLLISLNFLKPVTAFADAKTRQCLAACSSYQIASENPEDELGLGHGRQCRPFLFSFSCRNKSRADALRHQQLLQAHDTRPPLQLHACICAFIHLLWSAMLIDALRASLISISSDRLQSTAACRYTVEHHEPGLQACSLETWSATSTAHAGRSIAKGNAKFSPPANWPPALQVQKDRRQAPLVYFSLDFWLARRSCSFPHGQVHHGT